MFSKRFFSLRRCFAGLVWAVLARRIQMAFPLPRSNVSPAGTVADLAAFYGNIRPRRPIRMSNGGVSTPDVVHHASSPVLDEFRRLAHDERRRLAHEERRRQSLDERRRRQPYGGNWIFD